MERNAAMRFRALVGMTLCALGLVSALEWLAQEFSKHSGIACELQLDEERVALHSGIAMQMNHIYQYALISNIDQGLDASC